MKYRNILHVDDDEDDCFLFSEALKEISDTKCLSINSPVEALRQLESYDHDHDLIILDINMPVLTGFELLEAIKKNKKLNTIPVIMFSTSDLEDYRTRAMELGAIGYYVKPMSFPALLKTIKEIFGVS